MPRILYRPDSAEPYKISRSKIDLFTECPRCFYFVERFGVKRPQGPPFTLNSAVDALLKREFDVHRASNTKHPLMERYGIDAMPVPHESLEKWRHNFTGVQRLHKPTNLLIFGAIDDLWKNSKGEYIVVDYKATAKAETVTELANTRFHNQYRRQIEVYQWLLRGNGLEVSNVGYFVYCTGKSDREAFDGKLEFDVVVIAHEGSDAWIEPKLMEIKRCLEGRVPESGLECEYCAYREFAKRFEK